MGPNLRPGAIPELVHAGCATGCCESSAAKATRLPVVEMAALLKRLWLEICRVCSTFSHLRTRRTHVDPKMVIEGNFAPYKAVEQRTFATPLWPGSGPQSTYETFHAFAPLNMPSADATDESFQAVISPLNTDAPLNMLLTEVTLPTSHCDRPLP